MKASVSLNQVFCATVITGDGCGRIYRGLLLGCEYQEALGYTHLLCWATDVLGTCVIFEETSEPDPELEDKPSLRYKCHTAKKLLMKRTFLTEKKEGEESTGGVEYLKIKENDFTRRAGLICSFLPNRSSSKDDGGRATSKGALNPLAVQDKELSNASSGSEAEASDHESADLCQELESFTDDHAGVGCEMEPDPNRSVRELEEQRSMEQDGK
ncbi:general transcription factor 3C polypeptide 6 isoform X1 [Rhincodon typus]|uniref:general transcription factor 3C polypeptide 6 isoform X1 n=1 Tax=Rhincodon typus TaxID=259920 RepID=UPI00202DEAAD|nr:general transcription factor 3C polypeptide 6 isoform X1 [Rhincodon typus]